MFVSHPQTGFAKNCLGRRNYLTIFAGRQVSASHRQARFKAVFTATPREGLWETFGGLDCRSAHHSEHLSISVSAFSVPHTGFAKNCLGRRNEFTIFAGRRVFASHRQWWCGFIRGRPADKFVKSIRGLGFRSICQSDYLSISVSAFSIPALRRIAWVAGMSSLFPPGGRSSPPAGRGGATLFAAAPRASLLEIFGA